MRGIVRALATFMLFVLAPSVAYAQATLAGIARDTSGAVLPGVTVEAASPVTDREGSYRDDRRDRPLHASRISDPAITRSRSR